MDLTVDKLADTICEEIDGHLEILSILLQVGADPLRLGDVLTEQVPRLIPERTWMTPEQERLLGLSYIEAAKRLAPT